MKFHYLSNLKFIIGDSEDPFFCGFIDDFQNITRYSAYVLDITYEENYGYKYWQCVDATLFNDPETVLPSEHFFQKEVELPSDCMAECSIHDYPTAMVGGAGPSKNFTCTCLPATYRFRMSDLNEKVYRYFFKSNQINMKRALEPS